MQSNLDNAYEHLMDVSHPSSLNYGRHWSSEDVHAMYAPSSEAVDAVRGWLQDAGIEDVVHSENKVCSTLADVTPYSAFLYLAIFESF